MPDTSCCLCSFNSDIKKKISSKKRKEILSNSD